MSLILSGTDGLSDVDGSAATPAIRGTDANTGIFFPAADTIAFAEGGVECARFDSSGNFGLGVTPSAWQVNNRAIQLLEGYASISSNNSQGCADIGLNCYNTGSAATSGWRYTNSYFASLYQQTSGQHKWLTAASGTAGNPISFTQAMTLDASSRLLVGLTSSLNGNGAVQAGGFSDTRVVIDGSSTQGIFFTKSGADNGTYRVDASGNYNWFVKGAGTANMTLDASGNLLVGTTSGSARFTLRATSGSLGTFTQTSATGYGIGIVPGADTAYEAFFINNAANTLNQIRMFGNGNATFAGAVSKGSGSFRIDHPLPQLEETHQLVHSFIEGPQADLIYRGKVNLVNGTATVNIDLASSMTEGTFEALCREVQCFTTNESGWNHVRGSVTGNTLTIECQDQTASDLISWMVIGERKDKHMMDTDWTDDNGKVIIEPLKPAHRPIEENQERTSA